MTALGLAASGGHLDVVTFLIQAGADKEKPRNDGMTALGVAASRGHLDVVICLLDAGADKEKPQKDGMTAVILAAAAGHFDVARLLLEHGGDVDSAGRRPDLALQRGHVDIIRLMRNLLTEHHESFAD